MKKLVSLIDYHARTFRFPLRTTRKSVLNLVKLKLPNYAYFCITRRKGIYYHIPPKFTALYFPHFTTFCDQNSQKLSLYKNTKKIIFFSQPCHDAKFIRQFPDTIIFSPTYKPFRVPVLKRDQCTLSCHRFVVNSQCASSAMVYHNNCPSKIPPRYFLCC